jgi:murein DD-endopeptidase MepM/ murein hydrolase activator NlpD
MISSADTPEASYPFTEVRGSASRRPPRRLSVALVAGALGAATVALSSAPAEAATSHVWPVCTKVASEAGWTWTKWSGHSPSDHAIDINWGAGDDDRGRIVVASARGKIITKRDPDSAASYGKHIQLQHADGTKSLYAHLQWIPSTLSEGDYVEQGQTVGSIGYSGNYQYHLHYEQRYSSGGLKVVYINGYARDAYGKFAIKYPSVVRSTCR